MAQNVSASLTTGRERRRRAASRAEQRDVTRARLLDATISCICEIGYFDTTTPVIAERARVSRGALQHHFRTRDDLFLAVTQRVGDDLVAAFARRFEAPMRVADRVEHICRIYWEVFRSDAFVAQLEMWIGARNDRPLQERMQSIVRRMLRLQNELWRATFADLGVPPERLAALRGLTLAAVRGLAIRPAYSITGRRLPPEVLALVDMVARVLKDDGIGEPARRPPCRKARLAQIRNQA